MKIFLTGASGLVGSAFARIAARRGHHVTGVVGKFTGELEGLAEKWPIDLTQSELLTRQVLQSFPDALVNCAAISEPAACEANPQVSHAMNVALPARLAELAQHLNARLIHVSSEQVFDGKRSTPYSERDAVAPLNLYGHQKLESERDVLHAAPRNAAIVRAPLLMGDSPGGLRGLHERLLAEWSAGRTPRLFTDEFRQPCTAENLSDVLLELVERPDVCGLFHWAGTELVSRFALGERIRDHFRLTEGRAPLIAGARTDSPAVAQKRQACLALDLSTLTGRLKTRPQSLAEQLATLRIPSSCREWYLKS